MSKQPWQQGLFDGLCGVYSIINAVHLVSRDFTMTDGRRLFVHLTSRAHDRYPNMIFEGVSFAGLYELSGMVPEYLVRRGKTPVSVSAPYLDATFNTLDSFLDDLGERITNKASAAIVGLVNPRAHWTVINEVLKGSIRFSDSCGMKEMTSRNALSLTAGENVNKIDYKQTILISRIE